MPSDPLGRPGLRFSALASVTVLVDDVARRADFSVEADVVDDARRSTGVRARVLRRRIGVYMTSASI